MDVLRRAFHDISVGYSRGKIFGKTAFVKHLNYSDQIQNDQKRTEFFDQALAQGLFTNQQKIESLNKQDLWTDKDEKGLNDIKKMINELVDGKKRNMNMPSLVANYNKMIITEEEKFDEKNSRKVRLIGLTCESYADRELNDYYIYTNLFANEQLTTPLFSEFEFDYFTEESMILLTQEYNKIIEVSSDQNIKKLAMQSFFQNYFALTGDNFSQFFGKPIASLTFFQVRLISYGSHFRNIYSTHDVGKFPANVRDNPDLLMDYASTVDKSKKEMQEKGAYDEDAITVGMKKEDSKVLGINSKNRLAEEINKSGGNVIDWAMKR